MPACVRGCGKTFTRAVASPGSKIEDEDDDEFEDD